MQQLILDLALPAPWTLQNFICGQNEELLHHIAAIAYGPFFASSLYLWGSTATGKSHILKATTHASNQQGHPAYYVDGQSVLPAALEDYALLAIDNIHCLNESDQIRAFDLYNTYRESGRNFLAAGNTSPAFLPLRKDLSTRLGWGLVYELKPLSDTDKFSALQQRAQHLGFTLSDEVTQYLLRHTDRDLPSLMLLLTKLDELALTQHRHITIPLLKEILQKPL